MSKKALTVDDSKTMREMVAFTLKGIGFEVVEAGDGKAAVEVLKKGKVDVIITDLNMPNMNGIELIKTLRADANHKFTPILMLTTEADERKKNEGKSVGATGWIIKPFQPDKLISIVTKVCPVEA